MSMLGPRLQCYRTSAWLDIGLDVGEYGGALFAAGTGASTYTQEIGDIDKDVEEAAFLDQGGTFRADHGVRTRPIWWAGKLRVSTAALAAIMVQRDVFRLESGLFTFTSDLGIEYASCGLDRFEIVARDKRRISDGSLNWLVPYQIMLSQLEVG